MKAIQALLIPVSRKRTVNGQANSSRECLNFGESRGFRSISDQFPMIVAANALFGFSPFHFAIVLVLFLEFRKVVA
jgi:hypothetical protein